MQRLRVAYNFGLIAPYNLPWRASVSSHHRRTRRGVGGGGRPPGLENFQGKLCFQGKR